MIRSSEIELRVNKMAPDKNAELKSKLYNLQRRSLPFHPLILVFSTGSLSVQDCLPMARDPMPDIGVTFSLDLISILEEAVRSNPSIHDGAIIFSRETETAEYRLSAWSMRIVSNRIPNHFEPNVGSAHNSALALSLAPTVELCAIFSNDGLSIFEKGLISRSRL